MQVDKLFRIIINGSFHFKEINMLNNKLGIFVIISFIVFPSLAKDFVFAIVGKEESSPYYLQAKQGCLAAAQKLPNVKCLYRGPSKTDVRLQNYLSNILFYTLGDHKCYGAMCPEAPYNLIPKIILI
jgi:hypothetical protein